MVDVTVIPLWLDGSELSLSFFGIEHDGSYAQVFRHVSGRVDAQKEVVKERVGEDRCNVQVLCFQSCSVCRFIPVEFPAPLDNILPLKLMTITIAYITVQSE